MENNNIYAYSEDDFIVLKGDNLSNTTHILANSRLNEDISKSVDITETLCEFDNIIQTKSTTTRANYQFPAVKQSTSNTCWAACMSSVLEGYGIYYTESQITSRLNKANKTAATSEVANYYPNFGLDCEYYGKANTYAKIKSIINNNGAIHQAVTDNTTSHAVVIIGYKDSSDLNSIIYMDPTYGGYYNTWISSSNYFTIGAKGTADCIRNFSK